jgi:hypothetical protein
MGIESSASGTKAAVYPFSEPLVHIYGKGCSESPPANDDAILPCAEPLCSWSVHLSHFARASEAIENEGVDDKSTPTTD